MRDESVGIRSIYNNSVQILAYRGLGFFEIKARGLAATWHGTQSNTPPFFFCPFCLTIVEFEMVVIQTFT